MKYDKLLRKIREYDIDDITDEDAIIDILKNVLKAEISIYFSEIF